MSAFLVALAVLSGWVLTRGVLAYLELSEVKSGASQAVASVYTDPDAAATMLKPMAAHAASARQLTSDPLWNLAEDLPWFGPQFAALGAVSESSDELLGGGLLPLVEATQNSSIDAIKPVNGRFDTVALRELQQPAEDAAVTASRASARLSNIDRTPLIGAVSDAVDEAGDTFETASSGLGALARTTSLLPSMLGEDGPRNYLLLVQNNAEWRSLGGITGTAILLHTDGGVLSISDTRSATSIYRDLDRPVVELPQDIQRIYQTRPARYFHNLTQIPDFTIDGPLAKEMYRSQTGVDVDGVIAVDPVVLSYLLSATGPVSLVTGENLTARNAVRIFMSEVYARYSDPADQDNFFASATGSVFDAFLRGRGSTAGILTALGRGAGEHRVLMWAANPAEQSLLQGSTLAGELPLTDSKTARFGVYLNDGTGSKMSYYVQPRVSLHWSSCPDADGTARELTVTVQLRSAAPTDAGASLPTYVTGNGVYGVPPGSALVVSNIYLPAGYQLAAAAASDGSSSDIAELEGRSVVTFGSTLAPSAEVELTVTAVAQSPASEAEAYVTPTADQGLDPVVVSRCPEPGGLSLE